MRSPTCFVFFCRDPTRLKSSYFSNLPWRFGEAAWIQLSRDGAQLVAPHFLKPASLLRSLELTVIEAGS